ncbi:MAG: carbonic anhydrase, partial [Flavobacteriaceae bacterium]
MNLDKIFENNQNWINERLHQQPDYFKKLASGQDPKILYIGCSDSRVTAEELMGACPGEVFVHRNIANMVISIDMNVMSVINYAVAALNVEQIIVCGHYGCGGVKAAMEPQDAGILNPWLRNVRDVYRMHKNELNTIENEEDRYKKLVEFNVQEQCLNVIKTAVVQKAYYERGVRVHGWVFDIHTGKLIDLNINFEKMMKETQEIYNL